MTEVFLGPRAYANLLCAEQGRYRFRVLSTGACGVELREADGTITAYACEPITDANRAEAEEVRREAEQEMLKAMAVLEREYRRVARTTVANSQPKETP